jgi:hypothetical protein
MRPTTGAVAQGGVCPAQTRRVTLDYMSDDIELIGGQEKRDIRIVAYDLAWPA